MEESYELIVVVFDDISRADDALAHLIEKKKSGDISVFDIAVIEREEQGKVHVKEPGDVDTKHGAVFGAVAGGLVGLIGGPIGVVVGAAAGAITGGIAADRIDTGFSNEFLDELAQVLKPGNSALVVLSEEQWIDNVLIAVEEYGGVVLRHAVRQDVVAQLIEMQKNNKSLI